MDRDPHAHEFTFGDWLKMEALSWVGYGLFSGVATAIGTENLIGGTVVLVGVFVAGIVVWAVRAWW